MTITCSLRQNVAYIRLRDKTAEVETLRISDDLNIDLAPDGTVYGMELLNANAQLGLDAAKTAHEKTVHQRQIAATDRQIDQLVYNLNDDEIRIVEEAIKEAA